MSGLGKSPEKRMATHSSSCLENSMVDYSPWGHRVGHDWATNTFTSDTSVQFISCESLSRVQLYATPWTAARQASLSITNSWSLLKLMSMESVMPSNHLILCYPLFLPPSIIPSIRVFSSESVLHIRWQKYWSFSFNISPSNEYSGLISFKMDSQESSPAPQFKSISSSVLNFLYSPTLTSIPDYLKNHSFD